MEKSKTIDYSENVSPTANDFGQKTNFGPPPQPVPPVSSFTPHQSELRESGFGRLYNNRRQLSSIAGGLFLMINSGLHIGWGIWRSGLDFWTFYLSSGLAIFMILAWPVGAFIGGFAGSLLTPILRKNFIYYLSAGILIIGDIVILIWDDKGQSMGAARLLIGVAHGIGYVTLITHAGENAVKDMRGRLLSTVNCMLYTGIFISLIITGTTPYDWPGVPVGLSMNRIVALVSFVLAILAICGAAMTVETVPFLLHRNCHENAKFNLIHLRGSSHDALELTREMEEFHLMIAQDKQNSSNIFTDGNGKPLALTILMRIMVAMTNNYLINIIVMSDVFPMFYTHQYRIVPLVVVAPRLAMSIIQIFYADVFKRKIQIIVSSMLAGILLIIIGIVLSTVQVRSTGQLWTLTVAIAVLWLIFQFSCSMGMDQMQDVYLSEAFSTAKKQWSLPFVAGIEHLLHIFMIGMFFVGVSSLAHLYAIIFLTGFVVLILGIALVVVLPETRNLTLKQANDSFKNYSINLTSPFA